MTKVPNLLRKVPANKIQTGRGKVFNTATVSPRKRGRGALIAIIEVRFIWSGSFGKQKTLLTFRQAGWKNLCLVRSDWSLLLGSFNQRSNVPGNRADVHALGEVRTEPGQGRNSCNRRSHFQYAP